MKMLLLEANIDDERQTVVIRTREVNENAARNPVISITRRNRRLLFSRY